MNKYEVIVEFPNENDQEEIDRITREIQCILQEELLKKIKKKDHKIEKD